MNYLHIFLHLGILQKKKAFTTMDSVHCAIDNYTTLFSSTYVHLLCLFKENLEKEKENEEREGSRGRKGEREEERQTKKVKLFAM